MKQNWSQIAGPDFDVPGETEIQVYLASLDQFRTLFEDFYRVLDEGEKARADAFVFERDRIRYVLSHGILRTVLARALGCAPPAIQYHAGAYGKPAVVFPAPHGLEFNLSHSGERALIAVTRGASLGADIEQHRDVDSLLALARAQFAAEEYAALVRLSGEQQTAAFFDIWARKEAFIKAIGLGLSADLQSFAVSSESGENARFLRVDDPDGPASEWRLYDLSGEEGYSAALAHRGAARALRLAVWPGA